MVENKAGANGAIGTTFGARSLPDGYTIMAGTTGSLAMNAALKTNLPYDPIKDFAPVTIVAEAAFLMTASPKSNIKSVKEVIERSKKGGMGCWKRLLSHWRKRNRIWFYYFFIF